MEGPDKPFAELAGIVRSWIPRRSEPANLSRDFWMPDHSCRVCYECDSQFTVFNRRHHCRLCGRIFCGKCTANSIPILGDTRINGDEADCVRVCNFCFKQWEQDVALADSRNKTCTSASSSTISLVSTKSTVTVHSAGSTAGTYTSGPYQHVPCGPGPASTKTSRMEICTDKQEEQISDSMTDAYSCRFGYSMTKGNEDDEYGISRCDSEVQQFEHADEYYGPIEFEETLQSYNSSKINFSEDNINHKDICSPMHDSTGSQASLGIDKMDEELEPDGSYECDTSSAIYDVERANIEPVDFENNGLLWLPPEPEDEEDEREVTLLDVDEEEDAREWAYAHSSSSFGSGECRSRDQSNEEHKKAMINVVDGHFRALIAQLLQVENLLPEEEDDKGSWLEIIMSLSWEAATLLKPDTSKGGGMDPGGYVKIKCLACGHRSESKVVNGVVCKKNVAHRRMTSKFEKPRLAILGGALEYQRVTNALSSFDTLLQQEMDHLKMAVAKIVAQQPNVLLVEKSVSRSAQEYLLAKGISLVLNIKRPVLERISRCTGAQIVPSIDHLSSSMLGHCDLFYVEKFFECHDDAGQGGKKPMKTLMFLEGCPKPLGCTVLLKGASLEELKKVKHVIQYGVFAAYHLALETSFLADEGASLPELPLKSPITVALPDKPSRIDRSISVVPGFTASASSTPASDEAQGLGASASILMSTKVDENANEASDPSPGHCCYDATVDGISKYSNPAADVTESFAEKAKKTEYIQKQGSTFSSARAALDLSSTSSRSCNLKENSKVGFRRVNAPTSSRADVQTAPLDSAVQIGQHGDCHEEISIQNDDKGFQTAEKLQPTSSFLSSHQDDGGTHDQMASVKEEFSPPSDHQSILVSVSTRCVWKGTVCQRSQLFRIKYYSNFDKPLGRFLRDHLFDQNFRCRSCEMPSEAHVHCYTHRQGSLTISVRKLPEFLLPGERDGKIWMWHRCLLCPRINGFPPATRRIVMSDAAWGLSFGKFLELSFSNHAAASRVASCGHSLHRDCLRFYGYGRMVACFRYAAIDVNSVYLPPFKVDFDYQNQEWIQKEANEVISKAELLFTELQSALHRIIDKNQNGVNEVPELRNAVAELEELLQKEKSEFEDALHKVLKKEMRKGQPIVDILEINELRQHLNFHSYLWYQRLVFISQSDKEMLNAIFTKNKKKLSTKSQVLQFPDVLSVDSNSTEYPVVDMHVPNHLEELANDDNIGQSNKDVEPNSFQETDSRNNLYSCSSASEQSIPLENDLAARRTLSDGQFPVMTNLSETFDAKWSGENATVFTDLSMLDPSTTESSLNLAVSNDLEEYTGPEATQSFASILLSKLGDSAEDISSRFGLNFFNIYRSINRNWGAAPRVHDLNECNSVFGFLCRELEHQCGPRFLHVGASDVVIPIYNDEPTSIISFALALPEYHSQLSDDRDRVRDTPDSSLSLPLYEAGNSYPSQSFDEMSPEYFRSFASTEDNGLSLSSSRSSQGTDPLIFTKALHARVSFSDESSPGKVKYTVTCYFAKRFDALRRACSASEVDYIRSLSRCKKWGAQGGKSNVFFAKSLDDRFIVKQVTKTELESFIKFAPEYFKYLSESIGTRSPTCLAKILGIYQVTSKSLKGGKDFRMDVLVMENLLFRRNITRLYDLKGSSRSRYNADSSGNNKVLLDQNLIESMPTSPIFVENKAKRVLERAVWNDTSFLASIDVMDYSLLVGIDEEKHELVLGIIDFMRQYTWDKHLETWVKASGILGGPKNVSPTVISPKQYKKRFRKAMSTYFLVVPDQWSPPTIDPSKVVLDEILQNDYQQDDSVKG